MWTITAILEPDADGTLHIPLPPDALMYRRFRVTATIEPVVEIQPQSAIKGPAISQLNPETP